MLRLARSLLLVALLAAPPAYAAWAHDAGRLAQRRSELDKLVTENAGLRAEVADLRRRIEALRTDPRFMERVARDELGWIRDGEVVYRVSVPPRVASPADRDPADPAPAAGALAAGAAATPTAAGGASPAP